MKPSEIRPLRERWRSPSGRELTKNVARWLAGAARRRPRGVLEVDGRADLRGFTFPDARVVRNFRKWKTTYESVAGTPQFTGVQWRGLDLRDAVMRNARFRHASILDCRFDSADLIDWRLQGTIVSNSSFVGADLDGSVLGSPAYEGRINRWDHVNFDRATLMNASFDRGVLHGVTFRHAKLRNTSFGYVDITSATFEGLLHSVTFFALLGEPHHECWMRDVDFRDVIFRNGQLEGYRTENVRLPPDVLLIPDYPTVHTRAVQSARDSGDAALLAQLEIHSGKAALAGDARWDLALFVNDFVALGHEEAGRQLRAAYERALVDSRPNESSNAEIQVEEEAE